jgi:hypothetical protein
MGVANANLKGISLQHNPPPSNWLPATLVQHHTAADLGRKWQLEIPLKFMDLMGELGPVSVVSVLGAWCRCHAWSVKRHEPTAQSLNYLLSLAVTTGTGNTESDPRG